MSGYRSYVPWKSSLPYKAGTNSTYSSRDDVNVGESKSRLGLTASPATYRPSFSGGTYRSVKRDAPLIVPLQKSYGTTYDSANNAEKDASKAAQTSVRPASKINTQLSKQQYVGSPSSKNLQQHNSRCSNSTGNLSKYDRKSRDASPAINRMPNISVTRAKSRDPSPLTDRRHNTGAYSGSTTNLSKFGHRSRDPSPAQSDLRLGSGIQNRINLRAKSIDPSTTNVQYKSRLGSSQSNYSSNYRLSQRDSKSYSSKYGPNSSSSSQGGDLADKALSYMSISDFRARSASRTHNCTRNFEKLSLNESKDHQKPAEEVPDSKLKQQTDAPEIEREEEVFISVKVVTRATSPTPPGASSIVRARRLELAKTVEKMIQRSSRKPKCIDKAIQSDRLDDTTRYSRFSSARSLSNGTWSNPLSCESSFSKTDNSKYSTSSNNASSSSSKASKNDINIIEKKGKDELNLVKTNSKTNLKQDKSKNTTESKLSKTPKSSTPSKQRSLDSSGGSSSRSLPPTIPKAECSTKSSSSSAGSTRWPNKDFRKSVLNVGPTDRPRKSRTPSTGTDTEEKCELPKTSSGQSRLERSPSVASEAGSLSSTSSKNGQTFADDKQHSDGTALIKQHDIEFVNSFGSEVAKFNENSSESFNQSFSKRNEYPDRPLLEHDMHGLRRNISANVYPAKRGESSVQLEIANSESPKSMLFPKLSSISNFFATRSQDKSDEEILLDESSGGSGTGGSISGALRGDSLKKTNSSTAMVLQTQSHLLNPTAAVSSTTNSDLDESSWWQNTSQQIDSESALDVRDEMKYKLRHIDSGEVAWWMRNESDRDVDNKEDDTIAADLTTLNHQNDFDTDPDRSDRTDRLFTNESKRTANRDTSPWWLTDSAQNNSSKEKSSTIKRIPSGEEACWVDESIEEHPNDSRVETSQREDHCDLNVQQKHGIHSFSDESVIQREENNSTSAGLLYRDNNFEGRNSYQNQKLTNVNEDSVSQREVSSPQGSRTEPRYNIPWWMAENTFEGENKGAIFKVHRIESGERAWWLSDSNDSSSHRNQATVPLSSPYQAKPEFGTSQSLQQRNHLCRNDLSEQSWQSQNEPNTSQSELVCPEDEEVEKVTHNWCTYPLDDTSCYQVSLLGHRRSPEGLEDNTKAQNSADYETKNKNTIYSNKNCCDSALVSSKFQSGKADTSFISHHKNIDDILGGSCRPLSPLINRFNGNAKDDVGYFLSEIPRQQVQIHDSIAQPVIQRIDRNKSDFMPNQYQLDDAAIQVYKDGDYGAYLDLESSLAEQAEEIEGLDSSRKNSLVVRTQLSVRVHAIIEKLLSSEGSELRRALFSLKQIFQEDKDLVHGFVALGGLNCLVRVGNVADQNYQNYILRALGQVMLYVDGMNGVMKHGPTIQWLYSLIASKYRLVVKTALKLLLVFVEYVESNCELLVKAVHLVDKAHRTLPWSNIMKLLKDYENADTELLIYATSLINKTLSGLNDQDSFYDESDFLEQQGMEGVVQRYMSRPGTDLDLLDQLQLYEAVLKLEDGETDGIRIPDNSIRKTMRLRNTDSTERRKSRRHSTGTSPSISQNAPSSKRYTPVDQEILDEDSSSSNNSNEFNAGVFRENKGQREGAGVTPGLRRRRERAERQKSFMREQQEALENGYRTPFDTSAQQNKLDAELDDKKPSLTMIRDNTVKDLTQKLKNIPSPQEEKQQSRIGDMTGLISKAKEGLAKSKSKGDISRSPSVDQDIKKAEPKKSENELHWEELVKNMTRPLTLCDLDFTDLNEDDEKDVLAPRGLGGSIPPPPPPIGVPPPIRAIGAKSSMLDFPPPPTNLVPPPNFGYGTSNNQPNGEHTSSIKKNKKTVKLFWKEVREDMIPLTVTKTIWDELPKTIVDIQKLEHLFESRAKDLMTKKQQEMNKNKEIIILDHKRSNAINIAMTKLPPPRAIKAAILKMDQTVVTREGIEKLLNMLPTDEERAKIQEAQMASPELPLGSAEQFLLTLSSISELSARLKLWAFKLDFENTEKEIAEPLNDLKQGLELLKVNKTFKCILSTLLSIGIFLNGAPVKGFQIEYLAKVPEVKDTVHKHSLLHHLCHMVMETSPDTTDLYSEIGPITRASKADFADLAHNIAYLETECKASWDRLKLIAKHDCPAQLKQKLVDFLAECAERIIILEIVHRRVINRYRKFLLWLGVPQHRVAESKPNEFCRILSEFALEYRTTRERVQQQIEKKANHRERNKTRGKMIIDVGKFRTQEDRADAELKQLLGSPNLRNDNPDGTLTWRRRRAEELRSPVIKQNEESFTDGDDEILESLVKTATKAPGPRPTPRERKRTRHADRKSLKRSRTRDGFTAERIARSPDH